MKVKRTKKWALDFFENKKGKIEFSPKSLTISWGILGGGGGSINHADSHIQMLQNKQKVIRSEESCK